MGTQRETVKLRAPTPVIAPFCALCRPKKKWSRTMEYFQQLITRAWNDTWEMVFGVPLRGIIIAALIFVLTVLLHWRRKGMDDMKDLLFGGIEGAVAAVILFVLFFLLHLFVLSPKNMAVEIHRELTELRRTTKTPADSSPRIRLDVADEEGRKELEKTRAELEKAQATIRALDPIQQPIASVAVLADVFIKSDQQFNNHFMDAGGWIGFGRGSKALLATNTGESIFKTIREGEVLVRGVFNSPVDGPLVGQPIPELRTAEYLQLQFKMLPPNAEVLRGTIVVTLNGTQRFEFQVPAQTATGDMILVRDLYPLRSKLPAATP